MVFARRRFDPQPTAQAAVLLATTGEPFSKAAIRRARELAGGEPVAVLFILKVYGSQFGLPNPGLLPTRKERDQGYAVVQRAITSLERQGCTADGQLAATRSAGRTIAKVARVRKVRHVVMDDRAGRREPRHPGQRAGHGTTRAAQPGGTRTGRRPPVIQPGDQVPGVTKSMRDPCGLRRNALLGPGDYGGWPGNPAQQAQIAGTNDVQQDPGGDRLAGAERGRP